MSLSVGAVMRSLDTHGFEYEWRQDGKLYAIRDTAFGWEQVPIDADGLLDWLGYAETTTSESAP